MNYPAEDDENDEGIAWLIRKDYCYIFTQRLGQFVVAESESSTISSTDVYEDVNQNNNNNGDDEDEYELADLGTEIPRVLVNGVDVDEYELADLGAELPHVVVNGDDDDDDDDYGKYIGMELVLVNFTSKLL